MLNVNYLFHKESFKSYIRLKKQQQPLHFQRKNKENEKTRKNQHNQTINT